MSGFRFKQFSIEQDRCAMKVGTDGVLLGAWARSEGRKILDIGTGTGLIAMMMAQRYEEIEIEAIDIDSDACEQARENVEKSPFANRIEVKECALQNMRGEEEFDAIVCNPPYFVDSLKSPDSKRSIARHTDQLRFDELLEHGSRLLKQGGKMSVILPKNEGEALIKLSGKYRLTVTRETKVYSTQEANEEKRLLIEMTKGEGRRENSTLIIEIERHEYTDEYIALTKDFYLNM